MPRFKTVVLLPVEFSVMNNGVRKLSFIAALFLAAGVALPVTAQSGIWREIRGKPLVKFDWNCAAPSAYPNTKLDSRVQAVLRQNYPDIKTGADRAFTFDLNGDRKPEYFIPLVCGATGNCNWGVFASSPPKLLGIVTGEYVYVHKRSGNWPTIIAYGHLSVVEGSLSTYRFRKSRYVESSAVYPINHRYGAFDLEIQGGLGHKMPSFLERARAGCGTIGL